MGVAIFFWLGFSVIVGIYAHRRGRVGFGWFVLALLFSPLLMGLLVAVLGDARPQPAAPDAPSPETHVRCPDCRELVRYDARKCKHCGSELVPQPLPTAARAGDFAVNPTRDMPPALGREQPRRFQGSQDLPPV